MPADPQRLAQAVRSTPALLMGAMLVLAQATQPVGCGRKNPATGTSAPMETPARAPEQPATPAELPFGPLAEPGTLTAEEVGTFQTLAVPATVTETVAVMDAGLKAADPGDRWLAVDGLWAAPWTEAKTRLIAQAQDPDPQVASLALAYLSRRGDPSLIPALEPFISWDDLWKPIPGKHDVIMRHREDFDIDYSPIEALARLKAPSMKPVIEQKLASSDAATLGQGVRLADRYGAAEFREVLEGLWTKAEFTDTARYLALIALNRAGVNVKENEAKLRAGITGTVYAPAILGAQYAREFNKKDWVPDLRKLLAQGDELLKATALETLGLLGVPLTAEDMRPVLTNDVGFSRVATKLDQYGGQTAIDILQPTLPPTGEARYPLLFTLGRLGWSGAIPILQEESKRTGPDGAYTRQAAAAFNALAEQNDPAVVPVLIEALNTDHADPRRSYAAIQGLGRLLPPEALPALVRYYRNYRQAYPGLAAY
ncbi:MAG TPA: HEAT repeat domain-containing protein, partial [bacterium]|nr:HEAT repeat domain-containing protein [bacterium]